MTNDKPNYVGVMLAVPCVDCRQKGCVPAGFQMTKMCPHCIGTGARPTLVSFEEFIDTIDEKRREVIEKKVSK